MSITIGNITKRVKSNKQNIKIKLNVNTDFEQSNIIQKRNKQNLDKLKVDETSTIDEQGDIIYNENEVINIPKKLDNLFDNLLCDNYYLYGISINSISFINSLLYVILSDFKFKNNTDQLKFSSQLKTNLIAELPEYFKKNKYNKNGFKLNNIEQNIDNNIFENSELHYISDYYSINLIVLDYYKFNYYTGLNYNESNNNVIIVKYNDIYLPLIHIFGEHPDNLLYKCIINKLKINNLSDIKNNNVDNSVSHASTNKVDNSVSHVSANNVDNSVSHASTNKVDNSVSKLKSKLRPLSSYKLPELCELAIKNNISILLNNDKKKTKKQLYDEILDN